MKKTNVRQCIMPVMILLLALIILIPAAPATAAQPKGQKDPLPLPSTISPELDAYLSKEKTAPEAPALLKSLQDALSVEQEEMAGVPVYIVTPENMPKNTAGKIVLELHGGGYTLGEGVSSLKEAPLTAYFTGLQVIHPDYRLAPKHPYPAAIDDAMAVYRELLKSYPAKKIGLIGTSAGGGMVLALTLRAKAEGLPLPGAIVAGTPWSDLTKTGDSYFINDGIDNLLVRYEGFLEDCAKQYAAGHDMKDPFLSPVYGDMKGFPPVLLASGTRDLFLSNTIRVQKKLREAGVPADLIVMEGLSHAEYILSPEVPETIYYYKQVRSFFAKYLE